MSDDEIKLGADSIRTVLGRQTGPVTVEVHGDTLTLDLSGQALTARILAAVADSMRRKLTAAGWRVTGRLIESIKVVGETIVASADRLKRDPRLVERFREVIGDPLDDDSVRDAAEQGLRETITVKRGN